MNRREFVRATSMGLMGSMAGEGLAAKLRVGVSAAGRASSAEIRYIRESIPPTHVPSYRGRRYEALVPATLDLAERAQLAVENVLTRQPDPLHDYETYQEANFTPSPIMYHWYGDFQGSQPKFLEPLPLLRSICGTEANLHVDQRMYEVSLQMVGEDGLTYVPVIGRPWALFDCWKSVLRAPNLPPADVQQIFNIWAHGRNLLALCTWHMRDPDNPFTQKLLKSMVEGLSPIGVEKGDFIRFPFEMIYRTPQEILSAGGAYGGEATAPIPIKQALASAEAIKLEDLKVSPPACTDAGGCMQGLARYFRMTGDERAGLLAGKLARYVRQAFEEDGTFKWTHVHMNCFALAGLLDYADATHDKDLKGLTQRGYEYARRHGLALVGFSPEGIGSPTSESCADADVTNLAIKLSEYGVGDYWEDVDRYVRNHLTEAQLREVDWIYRIHIAPGQEKEPTIGVFWPRDLGELLQAPGFLVKEGCSVETPRWIFDLCLH